MTHVPVATAIRPMWTARCPAMLVGHMPVAIALADDSLIVREGVAQILAAEPEMHVVASCGDLPSLLAAVDAERPDVVVTDIRMPPTSTDEGIRLATLLREEHPEI